MVYKCQKCAGLITTIRTSTGKKVRCNATPVVYWGSDEKSSGEIYTPNGEHSFCLFEGELQSATGLGYIPHKCFSEAVQESGM